MDWRQNKWSRMTVTQPKRSERERRMSMIVVKRIVALLVVAWLAVGCGSGNGGAGVLGRLPGNYTLRTSIPRPRRHVPIRG